MGLDKNYVQTRVVAADFEDNKSSVRFATTGALPSYNRSGNVITATANGALPSHDGVSPVEGDDLLFWHGASDTDNGIYTITQLGDGASPFILTRRGDADTDEFVTSGMRVPIEEGTLYAGLVFSLVTVNPITLNTTGLSFTVAPLGDHAATHVDGSDDIQNATASQKGLATAAQISKLDGIEAGADVTDSTNVDASGAVMEADFDANTILAANADNTPLPLTVAEQTLVGRSTGGSIDALTASEIRTLLGIETYVLSSNVAFDSNDTLILESATLLTDATYVFSACLFIQGEISEYVAVSVDCSEDGAELRAAFMGKSPLWSATDGLGYHPVYVYNTDEIGDPVVFYENTEDYTVHINGTIVMPSTGSPTIQIRCKGYATGLVFRLSNLNITQVV